MLFFITTISIMKITEINKSSFFVDSELFLFFKPTSVTIKAILCVMFSDKEKGYECSCWIPVTHSNPQTK